MNTTIPLELNPAVEEQTRAALRGYLSGQGQAALEKNLGELMTTEGGFADRFNYMVPRMPKAALRRLLVSGCAAGGEVLAAVRFGFREVVGTEVVPELAAITRRRLEGHPNLDVVVYDGKHVPFPDGSVSAVASGHIIEHTPSPFEYLKEHMRVLEPGGVLFLEFPDRYHPIELHTGVPSVEWMPRPARRLALRFRESRFSRSSEEQRRAYHSVRTTLQPVSLWQIRAYLVAMGLPRSRVIHHYQPAPGFQRLLIVK
jgi:SAM-dependent methyltransferase